MVNASIFKKINSPFTLGVEGRPMRFLDDIALYTNIIKENLGLYGDAQFTDGKSKAGDDTLISGQGNDQMWGDFGSKLTRSSGRDNDCDSRDDDHESEHDGDDDDGDDDHCSSNVNNYAGRDTFVFGTDNGKDTIFDFQRGLDKIELKGIAYFQAFNDLCIATSESNPANSVIEFLNGNSITLVGVNCLDASDFVFA
jgi:hypothetical protein